MRKILLAGIILCASGTALFAQQTPPAMSPDTQAMANKLMTEINENLKCNTSGIALVAKLQAAEERVKNLEAKYEPKNPEVKTGVPAPKK